MSDPSAAGSAPVDERNTIRGDRSRLVDHFKRVYTIVVGLAITEACRKLWPFSWASFGDYPFWMFAAFFITIVPIFHGGDRSLDVKYIDHETKSVRHRAGYIWDVYMLLVTAILFVGIAEAIPKQPTLPSNALDSAQFYSFMAVLLWFDVFVLFIDFLKSDKERKLKIKQSYMRWAPINALFGAICYVAANSISSSGIASIFGFELSLVALSLIIFGLAALRTLADYWSNNDPFMFP